MCRENRGKGEKLKKKIKNQIHQRIAPILLFDVGLICNETRDKEIEILLLFKSC